jgi:hypothetical protein
MNLALRLFTLGISVALSSTVSMCQATVDATGPVRERARVASMGRGGGVGKKIPLRVAIAVLGGWDDSGKIEVDFTLTNAGKDAVTIPISPNPGDFEPADPKAGYTVTSLSLQVIPHKRPGGILAGGAVVYGSSKLPETLMTLAPGDSVRVLTRVALPQISSAEEEDTVAFVASAMLNSETIKTVGGQSVSEMHEIGSAYSPEYNLQSLLKSAK